MKGNNIVSFVLITFVSSVFLFFLIYSIYNYQKNVQKNLEERLVRQISSEITSNIIDFYVIGSKINFIPKNGSLILIEKSLNIPDKISGKIYSIEFVSFQGLWNTIKINESIDEIVYQSKLIITVNDKKYYFDVPSMNIILQGKTNSDNAKLYYKRYFYDNQTINTIVIGDMDVIINLEKLE